ncbi:hypothetical protein AGMMS50256_31690 [Betaproteobacteria bacterium]|nr:hypothetical protein AGMMS50256_31690 [Betaproteobacteria bacterium]
MGNILKLLNFLWKTVGNPTVGISAFVSAIFKWWPGNCMDDFSCEPNKLPGYTYYPDEEKWRKDPMVPEGLWRGNEVSPELS